MRTRFESQLDINRIDSNFALALREYNKYELRRADIKPKALIMVTKDSHCIRELLYLNDLNELSFEIPLVVGNHPDLQNLVESHGIPFLHLRITKANKELQEEELLRKIEELQVDFVVLARYMQILSPHFCTQLAGRIINIHHSFLPGFKGAKPYHQAHDRGVKIIGATAHFVTADLDEGPIIEQDVAHVTHSATPEEMIALGRDIERRVLARAVKLYAENRIFIVGQRTVVFA